jgi:hypothetical protein
MSAIVYPYCRVVIDESQEALHVCPDCGTPHHADCFQENGGCTVFGCTAAPAAEPKLSIDTLDVIAAASAPVQPMSRPAPPPLVAPATSVMGAPPLFSSTRYTGPDSRVAMNDCATSGAFTELAEHLSISRNWVGAQFGWVLVWIWADLTVLYCQRTQRLPEWFSGLGVSYHVLVLITALVVQAGMLRSLMRNQGKHVRPVWGSLALLLMGILYLVAAETQDYLPGQILKWLLAWVVTPAIFFPFAAASNFWGWRLPWRSVLRVVCAWRWWLCVLLIGSVGKAAEIYFDSLRGYPKVWDVDLAAGLKMGGIDLLELGVWVLLLGWLAVLFDMERRGMKQTGEVSTPLPLSEGGGNAQPLPLQNLRP